MQILKSVSMLNIIPALIPGLAVFIEEQGLVYTYDGTSWVVFNGPGRVEYLNPADPVTIYVREDGYDDIGDGKTSATAYRQPQRALDDIPNGFMRSVIVSMGPGDFEPCYLMAVPGNRNARVRVVGDRSSVVWEGDAITDSTLAPGKVAQRSVVIPGGFSDSSDGEYWVVSQDSGISGFENTPAFAYVTLASTSPNLVIARGSAFFASSGPRGVYRYTTRFQFAAIETLGCSTSLHESASTGPIVFIGIEMLNSGAANAITCQNAVLMGCSLQATSLIALHDCQSFSGSYYRATNLFVYGAPQTVGQTISALTGVVEATSTLVLSGFCRLSTFGVIMRSPISASLGSALVLGVVDFETSGVCVSASHASTVIQASNVTVDAVASRFLDISGGSVYTRTSGTITGTTTSEPVRVQTGVRIDGLRAAANGTLTRPSSPGNEILVGGNAVAAFSTLPANDLAAGTPQYCFAT